MIHHAVEVALWMVALYGLGCALGARARRAWQRRQGAPVSGAASAPPGADPADPKT